MTSDEAALHELLDAFTHALHDKDAAAVIANQTGGPRERAWPVQPERK
jgi:hypothetical protein